MKRKRLYLTIGFLLIIVLAFWGINSSNQYPEHLKVAFRQAKENSSEFKKVLTHYSKKDIDEDKFKAAQYLIANSHIHSSQRTIVKNSSNEIVVFNPMAYSTVRDTRDAKDSLFSASQVIQQKLFDTQSLTSEYLINHIDVIIDIWRKSPWKESVDFNRFCKYILPYRVVDEPLTQWAEILNKKYAHIIDTLSDKSILNACKAVNFQLSKDILFDDRWYLGTLGTQTILELLKSGSGNCDDLTVYGACVMRSLGIPVAIDFDMHGRYNFGHSWCVVFDENGKSWSFGPGEQQPGEHHSTFKNMRWRRLTRVFRRNFEISENKLHPEIKDLSTVPPFFHTNNVEDVSDEYIKTFDIEYNIKELPIIKDFLYLCVFNNQIWRPIQWGSIEKDKVIFENMGADIMYLVGSYHNNRIHPISEPFILMKDGCTKFITDSSIKVNEQFQIDKISGYEFVKKDKDYQLFLWNNNKWKYVKKQKPLKDSLLIIEGLNKNTLYRFQDISRPFVVNDTLTYW